MTLAMESGPGRTPPAPNRARRDADIAALAKALGHPVRIGIVRLLLEKRTCIGCDIVEEVGLAQSTVSEHLRILKAAGVITGAVERPRVCYSLNPDALRPLARLLDDIFDRAARGELTGSICCSPNRADEAPARKMPARKSPV